MMLIRQLLCVKAVSHTCIAIFQSATGLDSPVASQRIVGLPHILQFFLKFYNVIYFASTCCIETQIFQREGSIYKIQLSSLNESPTGCKLPHILRFLKACLHIPTNPSPTDLSLQNRDM